MNIQTRPFLFGMAMALFSLLAFPTSWGQGVKKKWAADVRIRFFTDGSEGDGFGSILYAGALQAAEDTGANVEYLFSNWSMETMIQQLRESIATKPDGIAMQAQKAGILMTYLNVGVPTVRTNYGGGYIGADLGPQGYALGAEDIKRFGLKTWVYRTDIQDLVAVNLSSMEA